MDRVILVAEDEEHILRLMRILLEREGYTVLTAASAKELFDRLHEGLPDLLILDVTLPDLVDYEAFERIQADPATGDVAVMLLESPPRDAAVFRAVNGCAAIMSKPFDPTAFVHMVHRILDDGGPAAMAKYGDVWIEVA